MDTAASSRADRGRRERRTHSAGTSEFGNAARPAIRQPVAAEPDFAAIRNSQEFTAVNRRLRMFIFPMGALFLAWYFCYVLLSAYAPEFMSEKVFGSVNMGLLLGLLQFVSTAAVTLLYIRFVRTRIDPRIDQIREQARTDQQ